MFQFRVRDLLLLTALMAIYLTGFLRAFQSLKPGEFSRESGGLLITMVVFLAVCEVSRRFVLARIRPVRFEFLVPTPWVFLFVCAAVMLIVAFASPWLLDGAFFVLSIPFLTLIMWAIVDGKIYFSNNLVLYQIWLMPWTKVHRLPCNDDNLRIRFGVRWLGITVDIPREDESQFLELLEQAQVVGTAER